MKRIKNYKNIIKNFPLSFNDLYELVGVHSHQSVISGSSNPTWRCVYEENDLPTQPIEHSSFSAHHSIPFDLVNFGDGFFYFTKHLGLHINSRIHNAVEDQDSNLSLCSPYKLRISVPYEHLEQSLSIVAPLLLYSPVVVNFKIIEIRKILKHRRVREKFLNKEQFTIYLACKSKRTLQADDLLPPKDETNVLIQNIEYCLTRSGIPSVFNHLSTPALDFRFNLKESEFLSRDVPVLPSSDQFSTYLSKYVTGRYDNNYILRPDLYRAESELLKNLQFKDACDLAFKRFINYLNGPAPLSFQMSLPLSPNLEASSRLLEGWQNEMVQSFKCYEAQLSKFKEIQAADRTRFDHLYSKDTSEMSGGIL